MIISPIYGSVALLIQKCLIDFNRSLVDSLKTLKLVTLLFLKIINYYQSRDFDALFCQNTRLIVSNFKHPQLSCETELANLLLGTLKVLIEIDPSRTSATLFRQLTKTRECT